MPGRCELASDRVMDLGEPAAGALSWLLTAATGTSGGLFTAACRPQGLKRWEAESVQQGLKSKHPSAACFSASGLDCPSWTE